MHLFPSMARPHLRRASALLKQHCAEHGTPYTKTNLWQPYGIVIRYSNRVGLADEGDPFDCPAALQLRPRKASPQCDRIRTGLVRRPRRPAPQQRLKLNNVR